jgi:hypothetical protein
MTTEVVARRDGMQLTIHQGTHKLIMEIDCQALVDLC